MAGITVDQLQVLVTANTQQLQKSFEQIGKQLDDVQGSTSKFSATSAALFGVVAGAAQALVNKGINLISSSLDSAIKRFDTLNNFPKVMSNLGYSAQDSAKAIKKLNDGVLGLPTSLDQIASAMQNIAPSVGSIDYATDLTLALNNALIAGGKSAEMQATGMEQFSQAVAKGKPDMVEWKSIAAAMPGQLKQISNNLGYDKWQEMADAVTKGELSFTDVQDAIIRLDKTGQAGFPSFRQQAKNAAGGVQTSLDVMKAAINRGLTSIMAAIGSENISDAIGRIGKAFESALKNVSGLINFIARNWAVFGTLAAAVGGATAAFVAYEAYVKISAITTALWTAASTYMTLVAGLQAQGLGLLRAAWMALNITMSANPIGIVIALVVAITAALAYFFTQTETGRKVFETCMNAIQTAITVVWNWIKSNWPLLLGILTGPIGLAVLAIVKHWDDIKNAFSAAWNFIKSVWSAVTGFYDGVWNGIKSAFSATVSWFGSIFSTAWNAVMSPFNNAWNWFRDVFNRVVASIKSIDWSGLGIDIIKGIGSGIASMGGWLADQAKAAVGGAKDKLKSFLGIHSPSRVMRDEVGKMLGLGLAEGIKMSSASVFDAMNGLADISLGSFDIGTSIDTGVSESMTSSNVQPINLVVKIGEDTILDKMIDGINGKSFLSGTSVLNI